MILDYAISRRPPIAAGYSAPIFGSRDSAAAGLILILRGDLYFAFDGADASITALLSGATAQAAAQ